MSTEKYHVESDNLRASLGPDAYSGSVLITERIAAFYGEVLPIHARCRLVDLGCGTSPLRAFYEPLVDQAWSVDWPSSVHDVRVDAYADLINGLPFREGSMDTIVVSDVLEHLAEPKNFLDECRRVLGPNGTIIGNVPFAYWLHEEPHDYYRYTEHGLRHLLGTAGFRSVDVRVLGGGADVIVDLVGKLIALAPVAGPPVARWLQLAWFKTAARPLFRRALAGSARKLPLAYGFVASV